MIIRKSAAEIDRIARAGALVAETIAAVGERIEPGITTLELDRIADRHIRDHGGVPTSQGYKGYPRAICISVDDVVVHGIPDGTVVEDGSLVTIDVGVTLDGSIADSAYTFGVGSVDAEARRLLDVCQDALAAGITEARLGNRVGDISHAIQTVVEGAGFSVVKSLVGHGVGRHYHEDPHVPNFGEAGRGPRLSEGMTIAIEPMITVGGPEVWLAEDGWTIATTDGSRAAHFEHTVAILQDGPGSSRRASASPSNARALPRSRVARPPERHVARKPVETRFATLRGPCEGLRVRADLIMNTHDGQGANPARGVGWQSRTRRSRSRARLWRPCRAPCSASS